MGDPNTGNRSVNQWFNTSAFAQPAAGRSAPSDGTPTRAGGEQPGSRALQEFLVTGGVRLQFRLESFNVLNHTQFLDVSTNISSANFGVVTSARAARINQLGLKLLF